MFYVFRYACVFNLQDKPMQFEKAKRLRIIRNNNDNNNRGERGWEGRVSMVMEMQKRHMETQGEMDRKTVGNSTVAREEGRGGECGEKNEINWRKGEVERKSRTLHRKQVFLIHSHPLKRL